jgi:hypothetical protein
MELAYWLINGLAIYLVIKVPMLFPRLVPGLGIQGSSRAWSIVGVLLTSSFYAILHGIRATSDNWTDVVGFLARLTERAF